MFWYGIVSLVRMTRSWPKLTATEIVSCWTWCNDMRANMMLWIQSIPDMKLVYVFCWIMRWDQQQTPERKNKKKNCNYKTMMWVMWVGVGGRSRVIMIEATDAKGKEAMSAWRRRMKTSRYDTQSHPIFMWLWFHLFVHVVILFVTWLWMWM